MSLLVLDQILERLETRVLMSEKDKESLWQDISKDFALAGALRCEDLERIYKENPKLVEEYILAWTEGGRKKARKVLSRFYLF
jgi:hypothetical protein